MIKRMKKLLAVGTALLAALPLVSCTANPMQEESVVSQASDSSNEESTMKTIYANGETVKCIGRTYSYGGTLWLAHSGGGIEFSLTGKKAELTLVGDQIATTPGNTDNHARIAVYVDGERILEDMVDEAEKTYTILESEAERTVTVSVIKLSEAAMSTVGIKQITVDAAGVIEPAPEKTHRIEFIGDSITCGYGVDDEVKEHHFSTTTEDVTKAYAYQAAQALSADYSMVSFSGYGILSGWTDSGERVEEQTLPQYYDKLGFSYGKIAGELAASSLDWDFGSFEPELVVINLGTNDDSYCQSDVNRQDLFAAAYTEFLKAIREKNPSATILCTFGIMGTRLYPSIAQAVKAYTEETGDTNIAMMKFAMQAESDGYAADWHPTAATHTKAAQKLTEEIRALMNW